MPFVCTVNCVLCLLQMFIGIMCIVWMYCVLIIYAECFGFVVEAFIMTLMGAVVNAGSAANYIMVGFWAITYSVSCYNDCYERYLNLNAKIFQFIKEKLSDNIKYLTTLREEKQRYTAFKYFSRDDLEREHRLEIENEFESENEVNAVLGNTTLERPTRDVTYEDSIEYIDGKLHWKINHLVLFIDRKDVPRIPRELFEQICYIEAPGCPGPVYKGLLKATQKFMYMILFLVFVAIVVMAFGNMYNVSTTNQLLITLAGGFVPFVIRFVLTPKNAEIDLNTYTFEGKVHDILKNFHQTWPVHDLTFTLDSNVEQDIPGPNDGRPPPPPLPPHAPPPLSGHGTDTSQQPHAGGASNVHDVTTKQPLQRQVDLLITIRDDEPLEPAVNLRSEPGSLGSLTSDNRLANAHDTAHSPVRMPFSPMLMSHPLAMTQYPPSRSDVGLAPGESIPMTSINRNVSSPVNVQPGAGTTTVDVTSASTPTQAATAAAPALQHDVIHEEQDVEDDDDVMRLRRGDSKSDVSLSEVVAHIECRARIDLNDDDAPPPPQPRDCSQSPPTTSTRRWSRSPVSSRRADHAPDAPSAQSAADAATATESRVRSNKASRKDAQSPDEITKMI